jgi:glucose/arabinose dehydrogenase
VVEVTRTPLIWLDHMAKYTGTFVGLMSLMACTDHSAELGTLPEGIADTVEVHAAPRVPDVLEELAADTAAFKDRGAVVLVPAAVKLAKGPSFDLRIPEGYELRVAAEGLARLRFITPAPDGRMFITDMHDLTDNKKGRVYILDDWNEDSARFSKRHLYLDGLRNPNQVAFHQTASDTFLYVATTNNLLRYPYRAGDTLPSAPPVTIDTFPNYGLNYKYGGWHLTRSLAFHGDKLYVSIGSSCNACIEKEEVRATIIEMDPDGRNQRIWASGLRNAVGLKWVGNELFATDMGSDQFGTEAPEDKLHHVVEDGYYGWPYFYQSGDKVIMDTVFAKPHMRLRAPMKAYAAVGAHTAPLGFDLFAGFADERLCNSFIVALHGSSIVKMGKGYAIVRVRPGYAPVHVVDGFLQNGERYGRPCDVRMRDADSFWFTDDLNGVLYLVRRKT